MNVKTIALLAFMEIGGLVLICFMIRSLPDERSQALLAVLYIALLARRLWGYLYRRE
jgi:hypothetical protein